MARFRRSPYCVLYWDGDTLLIEQADTQRVFRRAERLLPVLHRLSDWLSVAELGGALGEPDTEALGRTVEELVRLGLVVRWTTTNGETTSDWDPPWDPVSLAMQRRAGRGMRVASGAPGTAPEAFKPLAPGYGPMLPLPVLPLDDDRPLAAVLAARRTIRRYGVDPLAMEDLARFLCAAARVTRTADDPELGTVSLRPSPSGGARHPLEVYVVSNSVAGLPPSAYHYDPRRHGLALVDDSEGPRLELLDRMRVATAGTMVGTPAVVILVTAVFARTMWKYGENGLTLVLKDLGCLFQTMYLVATALGLAPCAIGGGGERETARWLGLDPLVESPVGAFLLGTPGEA